MTLNIDREKTDPFYRYKMEEVGVKIEGRGNGIKTVLVNIEEIARSINRGAEYLTKFLSYELGANSIIDNKNHKYIVNGAHDKEKVQDCIYQFIASFVLCRSCRNPETVLFCSPERKSVLQACKACGHEGPVRSGNKFMKILLKELPAEDRLPLRQDSRAHTDFGDGGSDPFGGEEDFGAFK